MRVALREQGILCIRHMQELQAAGSLRTPLLTLMVGFV